MASQDGLSDDGLLIVHASLFRMGTKSMAEAYKILGYRVHHGLDDVLRNPWNKLEEAAEATFPYVPNARPRPPFTRKDWDDLWASKYDVATDMASPFVPQLIEAYPNAKVVVVQRGFESWLPSFQSECLDTLFSFQAELLNNVLGALVGVRASPAIKKMHFGFFNARTREEIEGNAQESYDAFFKKVREMVPPDQRLEYKLGDGWEPLCAFLGKDVPDVPFPRVNDRAAKDERGLDTYKKAAAFAAQKFGPALLAVLMCVIAFQCARK